MYQITCLTRSKYQEFVRRLKSAELTPDPRQDPPVRCARPGMRPGQNGHSTIQVHDLTPGARSRGLRHREAGKDSESPQFSRGATRLVAATVRR